MTRTLQLLLQANANMELTTVTGDTALMLACANRSRKSSTSGDGIVTILLEAHANIDNINNAGRTALMLSAQGPDEEIMQALLQHGANLSITDNEGASALVHASRQSPTTATEMQQKTASLICTQSSVRILLDSGATVDSWLQPSMALELSAWCSPGKVLHHARRFC